MQYDLALIENWLCFGVFILGFGIMVFCGLIYPAIQMNRPESMLNPRDDDGLKTVFGFVWSDDRGRWVRRDRYRKRK